MFLLLHNLAANKAQLINSDKIEVVTVNGGQTQLYFEDGDMMPVAEPFAVVRDLLKAKSAGNLDVSTGILNQLAENQAKAAEEAAAEEEESAEEDVVEEAAKEE